MNQAEEKRSMTKKVESGKDQPSFVALYGELNEIVSDIRHLNNEIDQAKYRIVGPLPVPEEKMGEAIQECFKDGMQNLITDLEVERGRLRATVSFLNQNF